MKKTERPPTIEQTGTNGGEIMAMAKHARTGRRGEQITVRFLRKCRYKILTVNYQTKIGETDIIAEDSDGTICFVEVKTRSSVGMFPPSEAVDAKKQKNLIFNAHRFLCETGLRNENPTIRFDIAEVILTDMYNASINYIKNAFE